MDQEPFHVRCTVNFYVHSELSGQVDSLCVYSELPVNNDKLDLQP